MLLKWYLTDIAQWYLSDLDIVWKQKSNKFNTVYLTIDDAVYSNTSFEEILTVLAKFNVNATFFVIESYINDSNRHLLIKAIEDGHHLANHGALNKIHALCTPFELENEIIKCEQLLKQLYTSAHVEYPKIKYFRPGCGYTTSTIMYVCKKLGYKVVLGSVYPSDPHLPTPNIYSWIIKSKVQNDDIIIIHDRWWTPSTLLKTLPYLVEKFNVGTLATY